LISPSTVLQFAANSALTALKSNNQFNQVPVLIMESTDASGAIRPLQVRLESASYSLEAQAAVSMQTLISINPDGTTNKQYITDNVAPGPRTWTIGGWISSSELSVALFTATAVRGIDSTIKQQVQAIWDAFYSRKTLKYRDKDGMLWPMVVIESLRLDADPLTENKVPISITIKEVNLLALDESGISTTAISNDPTSVYTPPQNLGEMYTSVIQNRDQILAGIFS
jgi:hypothetical protein